MCFDVSGVFVDIESSLFLFLCVVCFLRKWYMWDVVIFV